MLAWNRLGLQWLEMMAASHAVISHRTSRQNTPVELFEMGSEKVRAAMQSSIAMSRHALRAPPASVPALWNAWAQLLTAGMAPYHARARANHRRSRR